MTQLHERVYQAINTFFLWTEGPSYPQEEVPAYRHLLNGMTSPADDSIKKRVNRHRLQHGIPNLITRYRTHTFGRFMIGYRSRREDDGSPEHPRFSYFLSYLIEELSPHVVFEIGYQFGHAAIPVMLTCEGMAHANATEGGVVPTYYGFDIEDESVIGSFSHCRELILEVLQDEYQLTLGRHRLIVGDVADSLTHHELPAKVDLLLLDHAKELYIRELATLIDQGKIAPGSVVVCHDADRKDCSNDILHFLYQQQIAHQHYWIPARIIGGGVSVIVIGDGV